MTLQSTLPCRHRPQVDTGNFNANVNHTPLVVSVISIPTLPLSAESSSGTKRKRSERPISLVLNCQNAFGAVLSPSESESEVSSSSSESDSNSDWDDESDAEGDEVRNDAVAQERIVDGFPELENLRGPLLHLAYNKVKSWMASTQYVAPPQDRLPARKRPRTENWRPRSTYLVEEGKANKSELAVIARVEGYLHLACPFYVSNPIKYRSCLLRHDLQNIEGVINHLRQHHMEPHYCPMCHRTFNKLLDREDHIRARTCQVIDSIDFEGIGEHEAARLSKRDRLYYNEKRRWMRLWATVFPKMESPRSPYLEGDGERHVSMVRDYWATYGNDIVAWFLTSRNLPRGDQQEADEVQTALYQSTLESLLGKIYEEHWTTRTVETERRI